ncbi:hypothetical protein MMC20_003616 [Loxospora ochrophaea]|nr:hypothetical protein [Loxospora ochrophaea]
MLRASKRKAKHNSVEGRTLKRTTKNGSVQSGHNHATSTQYELSNSDEDKGRLESQQFLAISKAMARVKDSKKANHSSVAFQVDVREIAQHDRGHALLTSTISDKVTTVASVEMPSLLVGRPVTNSLFQKSKTMLHMSEELIRTCGEIAQILSKGEQSLELGTEWENDYKKLQLLLNTGMKATRGEIRTMMSDPHDKSKESSCERATSLPDIALWSGFSMCKADDKNVAQRDNEFWPVTARKTERGLRRMAKSLPGPPEQ